MRKSFANVWNEDIFTDEYFPASILTDWPIPPRDEGTTQSSNYDESAYKECEDNGVGIDSDETERPASSFAIYWLESQPVNESEVSVTSSGYVFH